MEKSAYMFEVPKWHKLDNVSKHRLALGRPQDAIITIQHLHVTKISVAHPDDDDRHGEVGGVDNGLSGVSHVCDDAIRQDQQDEILLKLLDKKWKIVSLVNIPKLLKLLQYKNVSGNSLMDLFKDKRAFILTI